MKKSLAILGIFALFGANIVFAHVSVKPDSIGVGKFQTFTVGVPNERDIPTIGLRLVIPDGVTNVSPSVKTGWNIKVVNKKDTAGQDVVSEIVWTGGSIPAHFRDDFTFSSKTPVQETTVYWKAYQTYKDGSIVAWELLPNQEQPKNHQGTPDFSQIGPASMTKIINDLQAVPQPAVDKGEPVKNNTDSLFVSMLAVVFSILAIYLAKRGNSGR
jgi:uncharacterized protein YcnI